jgi:hypothetical protein
MLGFEPASCPDFAGLRRLLERLRLWLLPCECERLARRRDLEREEKEILDEERLIGVAGGAAVASRLSTLSPIVAMGARMAVVPGL